MPDILIKKVPDEVHHRLKEDAARNRRSMARHAQALIEEGLERSTTSAFPLSAQTANIPTQETADRALKKGSNLEQIPLSEAMQRQLSKRAAETGISVEILAAELIEVALRERADADLTAAITRAYAEGKSPPAVGNWSKVEAELAATKSPFPNLEAAMERTRRHS